MSLSDPAAERGVLAGLCAFGSDCYLDIADLVMAGSFTIAANQVLFSCLENLLKNKSVKKVDYPSILSSANALGLSQFYTKTEETAHLRAVMSLPIQQESVKGLAVRVRKIEIAREYSLVLKNAEQELARVTGDESIERILSTAETPVLDYASKIAGWENSGSVLMGDGAEEYFQHLINNPRSMMGIPTGFAHLDKAIGGGLRAGSVDLIGARQKTGKSFFVDNVALHIAGKLKLPVLNVDTEMEKEEHLNRIGGCMSGLDTENIECGRLTPDNAQKLLASARQLKTFPYHYECVRGIGFEDVLARMRRWILQKVGLRDNGKANPCVIIYDYMKLMDSSEIRNNLAEHQILRFVSSGLKNFMGRYGVSCLCFAQLNRDGLDYEDTRVIRGSDGILDAVTSFSIYKWKGEEERAELPKYTHKLIPLICRHGAGLPEGDYINFATDYSKAKIIEGPTKSQVKATARSNQGFVVDDAKKEAVQF